MKKLKKLLSVVLAGAMALSLCATALATEPPPVTNFNDPDDLGDTIDATSVSEGKVPDKPISVILPVVSARQDGVAQLFDFILDPHNLIVQTEAAAYKPATGDAPTFDPATKLYFASETGAEFTYSGVSKTLKVTNTGYVPLNVDLDLTFDYGSADFDLVDSTAAAAWASQTPAVDIRPEMYLAVVSSDGPKTVLDPAVNENEVRTDLPTVTFTSANEYLTAIPEFAYTEDYDPDIHEEAFDTALAAATITLTFTPFTEGDPDAEPATEDAPANIAITGNFGDNFAVLFDEPSLEEAGDVTATISTKDEDGEADTAVATVTFSVAIPADKDEEAGTQTISFKVPHTGAVIETALGVLADSYKLAQTTDSATSTALSAAGVDVTTNGYYWEKVETNTSAYPAFTFHLEGNINEALKDEDTMASPWDKVNASSEVKFDMTWDVAPYSKVMARTQKTDPDGGASDPLPTVTVTTAATGTATSSKTATLAWAAPSSGKYASCEPTSAKSGNAASSSISISNKTATSFKLTATTTNKNSKCTITFSDGTNSVDVDVDGWYTGT